VLRLSGSSTLAQGLSRVSYVYCFSYRVWRRRRQILQGFDEAVERIVLLFGANVMGGAINRVDCIAITVVAIG